MDARETDNAIQAHDQSAADYIKRNYSTEIIGTVQTASHSKRYIGELLSACGFNKLKELKILLSRSPGERDDLYYAWVTKRES